MFTASFHRDIDDPWRRMEPIRIGPMSRWMREPDGYVTIAQDSQPVARIDAYAECEGAFLELIVWRATVVFGWSDVVHLVDPVARRNQSVACDGYFGHLYPLDSQLLIASASELICISAEWKEIWRRGNLGVDGVVVNSVSDGTIEGSGEWDPPGGWRPFRLDSETGDYPVDAG
jgi:hypothetical protein